MRISDWSSDVCSSDLGGALHHLPRAPARAPIMDVRAARLHRIGNAEGAGQALRHRAVGEEEAGVDDVDGLLRMEAPDQRQDGADHAVDVEAEIGRASWRARVCKYV